MRARFVIVLLSLACSSKGSSSSDLQDFDCDLLELQGIDLILPEDESVELLDSNFESFDGAEATPLAPILAGVGMTNIDPYFETYTDVNGNHRWDPEEPFDDKNQNGQLDTLWMGGFGVRQPTGSHDPLTARAVAMRIHGDTYVFIALDTLGFGLRRVKAVKEGLVSRYGLDPAKLFIASIHTHQAPDTIGVFAPNHIPGWDEQYLSLVVERAIEAGVMAIENMRPAHILITSASGEGLARDINEPVILDPYVGILQVVSASGGESIATMVTIANHPEAAWANNTLLSADYPYYLREKIEKEIGGLALYFSADIGLMQTPLDTLAPEGFERARVVGETYAERIIQAIKAAQPLPDEEVMPYFGNTSVTVELQNVFLALAVATDVADGFKEYLYQVEGDGLCGSNGFGCMDLEAPVLRLGNFTTIICVPAEVTPELVIGGIKAPTTYQSRFPDAPLEPIVMDHVNTPHRFFMGLCGTEVGYLYPKITFNMDAVFGQTDGPGPDCARMYLEGLIKVLDDVNKMAEHRTRQ